MYTYSETRFVSIIRRTNFLFSSPDYSCFLLQFHLEVLYESKINIKSRVFSAAFFRLLAAAYCLAFYSYDLLVSSDSDSVNYLNLKISLLFIFTPLRTVKLFVTMSFTSALRV